MNIEYRENAPIDVDALTALYTDGGWTGYTDHPNKMARMLAGSLWHMSAWDDGQLVGIIRCVGDGCSILYIQDILVRESYQRRGIGLHLLKAALTRWRDIRQTVLITHDATDTRAYYQAAGFQLVEETDGLCYVHYNLDR